MLSVAGNGRPDLLIPTPNAESSESQPLTLIHPGRILFSPSSGIVFSPNEEPRSANSSAEGRCGDVMPILDGRSIADSSAAFGVGMTRTPGQEIEARGVPEKSPP